MVKKTMVTGWEKGLRHGELRNILEVVNIFAKDIYRRSLNFDGPT